MGGGGKGSYQQQSTFQPPAWALAGGQQAVQTAQQLAQTPFEIPVQPIAGFSPQQQEAFQEVENIQGMANPYFQTGENLVQQGANPNISQYFGAESSGVMGEMENIFGQQQAQTTGNLQNQAGGIGADRIAIGQAELANQQDISAGQTLSQIMGQSVSQALQGGEQQIQAGTNIAAMGPAAQSAALQGATAELQTGTLQQQQQQNLLNAQYENQLQQISWPFQTNQYLGSMAAGVTPAMGGTGITSGNVKSSMANTSGLGKGMSGLGAMKGAMAADGGAIGMAGGGAVPEASTPFDIPISMLGSGGVGQNFPFDMPTPLQGGGVNYGGPLAPGYQAPAPQQPTQTGQGQGSGQSLVGQAMGIPQNSTNPFAIFANTPVPGPGGNTINNPMFPRMAEMQAISGMAYGRQGNQMGKGAQGAADGGSLFGDGGRTHLKGGGGPPPAPPSSFSPAAGETIEVPFGPGEGGSQPLTLTDPTVSGGAMPAPNLHPFAPIQPESYSEMTPGLKMNAQAGVGSEATDAFGGFLKGLMEERQGLLSQMSSIGAKAVGAGMGAASAAAGAAHKQGGGEVDGGDDSNPFAVPSTSKAPKVSNLLGGSQAGVPSIGAAGVIPVSPVQGRPSPQMQDLMKYKGPNPMSVSQMPGGGGGGGGSGKMSNQDMNNIKTLFGMPTFQTQDAPSQAGPLSITEPGGYPGTGGKGDIEPLPQEGPPAPQAMADPGPTAFDTADIGGDDIMGGLDLFAASGGAIHYDTGGNDPDDLSFGMGSTTPANPFTPAGEISGSVLPYSIESSVYGGGQPTQMASLTLPDFLTPPAQRPGYQGPEGSGKADFTGEPLGMPQVPDPNAPPQATGQVLPEMGAPGRPMLPQPYPGTELTTKGVGAGTTTGFKPPFTTHWPPSSGVANPPAAPPGPTPSDTREQDAITKLDNAAKPTPPPGGPAPNPPGGPPPGAAATPPQPPAAPSQPVDTESAGSGALRGMLSTQAGQLYKTLTGEDAPGLLPDKGLPAGQWATRNKDLFDSKVRPLLNKRGFSNEEIDQALGQKHPLQQMRASVFTNASTNNRVAPNGQMPDNVSGIALPHPIQKGQLYEVTAPNGQHRIVPQIDVGPDSKTGRGVDVGSALARDMGYDPANFPTDKGGWTVRPLADPSKHLQTADDVPGKTLSQAASIARTQGPAGVQKFMASQGYNMSRNWCGEFAASVVRKQGYDAPNGAAVASNWRNWGQRPETPGPDDVAVRRNNLHGVPVKTGDTGSHVTFVKSIDHEHGTFVGVGGNQPKEETFRIADFDFRRPTDKQRSVTAGASEADKHLVWDDKGMYDDRNPPGGRGQTQPAAGTQQQYGAPPGYHQNPFAAFLMGAATGNPSAYQQSEQERFKTYQAASDWDTMRSLKYGDMEPAEAGAKLADFAEHTMAGHGLLAGSKQGQPGTIQHAAATGQQGPGGGSVTPAAGATPPPGAQPGAPPTSGAAALSPSINVPPPPAGASQDPVSRYIERMLATRDPKAVAGAMDLLAKRAAVGNIEAETRLHQMQAANVGWMSRGNILVNPVQDRAYLPGVGNVPASQLLGPSGTPTSGGAPAPEPAPAAGAPPPPAGGAPTPLPSGAEPRPAPGAGAAPGPGADAAAATQPIASIPAFRPRETRPESWPIDISATPGVTAKALEAAQTEAAAAGQTEQIISTMENMYGRLGGFAQPGPLFSHRIEILNGMDTFARMLGLPGVSQEELKSGVGLEKLQTQLATASVKGLGREPGYILNMLKSSMIPNGTMPPKAFYGVIAEMRALNQRALDHADAMQHYAGTYGTLMGFEESFARANPPQKYAYMADLTGARGPQGQQMSAATIDAIRRNPSNLVPFANAWGVNPEALNYAVTH